MVAQEILKTQKDGHGCTLTGTAFTFTTGNSYTILLVTAGNNQSTFIVTR